MKKNILALLFSISLPCFVYSQQWYSYSDSITSNINKGNLEKAKGFSQLADNEIGKTKITKDTLYAHYLYTKGVLNFFEKKNPIDYLNESLDIWGKSSKKNYFKIMKIHFFLGKSYINENKYELAITSFENCYEINKKYKLKENANFIETLYFLAALYDDINKVKKYSDEYINIARPTAYQNFNFAFANAFKLKKDKTGNEKVLQEFLINYNDQHLNNPVLLFKINYELFLFYIDNKNAKETIKYGEKAFEIQQKENLKDNGELKIIFSSLISKYGEIGDNINHDKYEKLQYSYFPEEDENDYYSELDRLIKAEDFGNFKNKFDESESVLIKNEDYNELLNIYSLAMMLFERNVLFKKEDIADKLDLIIKNKSRLSNENKLFLDAFLSEYFVMTNNFTGALKICNSHLNEKDINRRLMFYRFKAICEMSLGKGSAKDTAYKTLEIAYSLFGENDPQLLPYLSSILMVDVMGTDKKTTEIASKALRILYDNNLEKTNIAIEVWINLGQTAFNKKNYKDAKTYYVKALQILESTNAISNPMYYYSCLLQLSNINLLEKNYQLAFEYSNKAKVYLDKTQGIIQVAYADYYYQLGNIYFFQDQFVLAKSNYEKSFAIYGESITNKLKFNYILCNYLISNDVNTTIHSLENYQKENNGVSGISKIIYLLKYNSGDSIASKNILVNQLKTLISENNQYFHLLSNYEKEILYKGFSDQFEFLNTHLLSNDANFLKEYVNFRFYSKTLLFANSFNVNGDIEKDKELYAELKNNTTQINKAIENKSEDLKSIEELKGKNREIEKFLSANTKPLTVPTLKDLNNKLKEDEAYIEIIRINKQSRIATKKGVDIVKQFTDSIYYGAIVIKKNKEPKFILIDDSNQLENQYVNNFNGKIKNKQQDLDSYHLLLEKIDNELKDIEKIYLVTDGVYNSINVESIYNPSKKQFIVDYLKIQQIQNVRTITDDKKEIKIGSTSKAMLFGNPDYDLAIKDTKTNDYSLERSLDSGLLDEIKTGVKISRLDGTQKEIETLNSILKDSKCSVEMYSSASATEDNLKKVQSPDILHIATHGYFLNKDNTSKTKQSISELINEDYRDDSYLKSGLLLAGAQNTLNGKQLDNANNGILTAEEAKSLNLRDTELVVLSACETGLGDNLVGQGVIGLQRAFMIAGAKSVIMSLWSVSDEKTQQLMSLFYSNWIENKMSKEDAFYQAKIEMKKLYPEPYYWAGFVLLE
jgi:CHAT domain-containing protein